VKEKKNRYLDSALNSARKNKGLAISLEKQIE